MSVNPNSLKKNLQRIMNREISEIRQLPFEEANSLTGKTSTGGSPISKFRISFTDAEVTEVIVKFKSAKVILNGIRFLNFKKSGKLYYYLARFHSILSFDHSFLREIIFYNNVDAELKEALPFVFGTYHNKFKNRYMIVMREFAPVEKPTKDLVYHVLDTILQFHILFYGKKETVTQFKLNCYSAEDYKKSRPLLRGLFEKLSRENALYFQKELPFLLHFIDTIHEKRKALKEHCTLTHNDFGPRNLFFDGEKVILYDWELAAYQNPEHDLIEYLTFVLHEFSDSEVREILRYYKKKLFSAIELKIKEEDYQKILEFNISEFIVNKLTVYRTAGKTISLDFIEDLCRNSARLLRIIKRESK